eukprot:CAMPEP_0194748870 /NCGR_PEP_ID=MMETSP0323_2-20130528/3046_1 /TAXON_ID=2866 ORGANISM="Crypthecodinium cohnii, Strain Seligo" /NCGR_SAMPLE_ID=MMETSP0323_2 /ASSEMBLY_ACC=CAM_ASM_000346 /LENGTH=62 /DNA_ID=CAMNT_0039663503 /DNA_START=52 /DNA_END=240 /DNA_ORIENTATION=+
MSPWSLTGMLWLNQPCGSGENNRLKQPVKGTVSERAAAIGSMSWRDGKILIALVAKMTNRGH